VRDHNVARALPNSRLNRGSQLQEDESKGWAMTEKQERLARERENIASRVASFRATQEKFEREREEYYVTTLSSAWDGFHRPPFWT